MKIRAATPDDREAWVALRSALWPEEADGSLDRDAVGFFEGRGLLKAVFLCETAPGEIVGMIELSLRPYADGCRSSPVAFVEGWYVTPSHRRRGIARLLLAAAEDWARANGRSELASDSYLDNAQGEQAHRALGFTEVERVFHWRKDLA